jgi:orotidine-5'-phosphate decarboxylase
MRKRLIAALDTPDAARAAAWTEAVRPHCGMVKLGLEYFAAHGPAGLAVFADQPVFLDLKLHDIPNTVAGAVRALLPLEPALLTLHAGGGAAMIAAARSAVDRAGSATTLLAVTVLTSLNEAALAETGVAGTPLAQVLRLGRLAVGAGAHGLVCSAHEVAALRAALGPNVLLVVPGIRPAGAEIGDQARTMAPREAIAAGADYIVVGRPITEAADPAAAAAAIAAEIADTGGAADGHADIIRFSGTAPAKTMSASGV